MRDPSAARRSENGAAELSLLRRHGRALAEGQTGGPHRKFGLAGLAAADHRHPEEGGGRRFFGGDPLLQRWPQAAPAGEGRDGPLYARGRTRLRRRAQASGGLGRSSFCRVLACRPVSAGIFSLRSRWSALTALTALNLA